MGEAEFGLLDGVLATESLWLGKAEGVRVTYDRTRLSFERLLARATATGCDRAIWTTTAEQLELARAAVGDRAAEAASLRGERAPRRDREQQYYLLQTELRFIPLTQVQATRINAAVRAKGLAAGGWKPFLSPRQHTWLARVRANPKHAWPVALGKPIAEAQRAFQDASASLD